jgi:hypothetical protein
MKGPHGRLTAQIVEQRHDAESLDRRDRECGRPPSEANRLQSLVASLSLRTGLDLREDAYWPAFRKIDFLRAIRSDQQRRRRFGK